jgi:2-methylcitrate dehydratase PrpD
MTTLEQLAAWAAALRFDEIPARVVEKARWQQASVLAASFAGLNDGGARKVLAAARKQGTGETRVIAGGFRAPRAVAAVANAAVSCTFDFDEILLLGHPGHSTVTLPLTLGEERGANFSELVAAQVAGNEIAGRLGMATFLGPQNGQMQPYLHCAGAAVAAGRLLGLDATQMAHALAVALAQPPAALWPAFLGPIEAKILVAAHATAMGLSAAELAAEGFTGALDLLDHPRGFFHRFTFAPFRRALGGLGRTWLSDTLQVKLHAACWYYQSLVDGLVAALAPIGPLPAHAVKSVRCRVNFLADAVDATERVRPRAPLTANEVNFAIPALVAVTLLKGRLHPADLTPERLRQMEPEVRALAARVTVTHDWALSRRMMSVLDGAIDVAGLVGDVGMTELARAFRRVRHEFPQADAFDLSQLLQAAVRAPAALSALVRGQKREYDLGERDVSGLLLPIPAAFTVELDGGRRLEDERDVPEGALGLPEGPARAAAKLRDAAPDGDRWVQLLKEARPDTPIQALFPDVCK